MAVTHPRHSRIIMSLAEGSIGVYDVRMRTTKMELVRSQTAMEIVDPAAAEVDADVVRTSGSRSG